MQSMHWLRKKADSQQAAVKLGQIGRTPVQRPGIFADQRRQRKPGRLASRRAGNGGGGDRIDVVAVPVVGRTDVAIDKISLPTDVRRGQPFEPRVVLSNNTQARQGESGDVKGKLRIVRRTVDQEQVISESPVTLPPGKTVVTTKVPETLDKPDFYIYASSPESVGGLWAEY